jgi:hypothetical protein
MEMKREIGERLEEEIGREWKEVRGVLVMMEEDAREWKRRRLIGGWEGEGD